jgi:dienelactone hydrolase
MWFENEMIDGKATRVFAYLGRPEIKQEPGATSPGRPALVLLHGGGGRAFPEWVEYWVQRGYFAIALDLYGNGPDGERLPDGMPALGIETVFKAAPDESALSRSWTYHAVAAACRACSLLQNIAGVNSQRIGIVGISWGGFISCIATSIDERFKVAVPVYGCGFLHESSFWKNGVIDRLPEKQRALWIRHFDPGSYLDRVTSPLLLVNGTNDPRFYLDSHRKSYRAISPRYAHLAIIPGLTHDHHFRLSEVERFVDAALEIRGVLPAQFESPEWTSGFAQARMKGTPTDGGEVRLHYASPESSWEQRVWTTVPAEIQGTLLRGKLPEGSGLAYYFSCLDAQGRRATSEHSERP